MHKQGKMVSITGPRPQNCPEVFNKRAVKEILKEKVKEHMINFQPSVIINGMAVGFDQLVVNVAIELNIPFWAYLPCKDQEKYWDDKTKQNYKELLKKSEKIIYISDFYTDECMHDRNKKMVDDSEELWALWNPMRKFGGTYKTVAYAESLEIPVYNFYQDLKK